MAVPMTVTSAKTSRPALYAIPAMQTVIGASDRPRLADCGITLWSAVKAVYGHREG